MWLKNTKECTVAFPSTQISLLLSYMGLNNTYIMHCCMCKATMVKWIGELTFCLQFVGEYRRFDRRSVSCIGHSMSSADITFPISAWPSVWMHGTNFVQACTHTHTALTSFLSECSEMICMRCQFDLLSVHLSHTHLIATVEVWPHLHQLHRLTSISTK